MNRPEWITHHRFNHDRVGVQNTARNEYQRIRSIYADEASSAYRREMRIKFIQDAVAVVSLMASWVALFFLGWVLGQ